MVIYKVVITEPGLETLEKITDRRIQLAIRDRIRGLAHLPELQGRPLHDDFAGFRSLHILGNRYRIVYRVDDETVKVFVVAVGIRKDGDKNDVYEVMRRYVRLGFIKVPDKEDRPKKPRK